MEPITLEIVFGSLTGTQNIELHVLFVSIVTLVSLVNVYMVIKMYHRLRRRGERFLNV